VFVIRYVIAVANLGVI